MSVTVYSRVKKPLASKKKVEGIVTKVLKQVRAQGDVSVHIIGDTRMKRMNREYRGLDRTTDVLSFPAGDLLIEGEIDLGDIFVSQPQIIRQAKDNDVSAGEEFTRMLVHGVLHLLGFDHETKKEADEMFRLQEDLVRKTA